MMKKLTMIVSLLMSFVVGAATEIVDGVKWSYLISDGKAIVRTSSIYPAIPSATTGAITIPSTLGGYSVAGIGDYAFYECSKLTSVTIPPGVTHIGVSAFAGCSVLKSVTMPESVTSIDGYAFYGCTMLQSLTIPASVMSIGKRAFYDCRGLESVLIPERVTSLGESVFSGCINLQRFLVASDNPVYCSKNGLLLSKDETVLICGINTVVEIPLSVTSIGDFAFEGCNGLGSITVPNSVTNVSESAFKGCKNINAVSLCGALTSQLQKSNRVDLQGWKMRDDGTYQAYTYGSPTLRISVGGPQRFLFRWMRDSIGSGSVNLCLSIDGTQKYWLYQSQYSWENMSIDIPEGQHELKWTASYSSSSGYGYGYLDLSEWWQKDRPVIEGIVPDAVDSVTSVTINAGSEWIKSHFCDGCSRLENVTIPSGVTNIGINAFVGCENIRRVNIPSVADWIGINFENVEANPLHMGAELCVGGEDVSELNVPMGVSTILGHTFNGGRFSSVILPHSVTNIATTAFAGCSNIIAAVLNGELSYEKPDAIDVQGWSMLSGGMFDSNNKYGNLSLKVSIKGPLKFSFKWTGTWSGRFLNFYIDEQQKNSCSSVYTTNDWQSISVDVPDGLHELKWVYSPSGNYSGCRAWIDLTEFWNTDCWQKKWPVVEGLFPDSFTNITSLVIADGTKHINPRFCEGCSCLETVSIPSSVTDIGANAFSECSSLRAVSFPAGITNVGANAFAECRNIRRVDVPSMADWLGIRFENASANPIHVGAALYVNGKEMTALVVPDGITEIGSYAFQGGQFESVSLPNSVTNVSATAFEKCTNITAVVVGGALSSRSNKPKTVDAQGWTMIEDAIFYTRGSASSLSQTLRIIVEGPQEFSFRWRATGISGSTYFYIDDVETHCIRGLWGSEWWDSSLTIPSGEHTLKWACVSGGCVDLTEWWKDRPVIEGLFPDSYTNIASVAIAEGTKFVNSRFCEGCSRMTSVLIPDGVTSIGRYAFSDCSELTSVTIPSSVKDIGLKAFSNCKKLSRINVCCLTDWLGVNFENAEANPLTMGASLCVGGKEITELLIPQGTTEIGEHAFSGGWCFTSILIPNSVTNLASTAFAACSNVLELSVPSWVNVSSIFADSRGKINRVSLSSRGDVPASAYQGCSSLLRVDVVSMSEWLSLHFPNIEANPLHTGAKLFVNGKEELSWDIPDGISKLDNYAFLGGQFVSMTIPNSVTNVAPTAFIGCSNINAVSLNGALSVLKPKVEEVQGWRMPEDGVFKVDRSTGLNQTSVLRVAVNGPRSFSFRWKATYSGNYLHYYIDGQQIQYLRYSTADWQNVSVDIPDGPHELKWVYSTDSNYGNYYGWVDFSEWWQSHLPIAELFPDAFTNITSVTISEGTKWVGPSFCEGCAALESVAIPSGVMRIGANAFFGCESLKQVNIPSVSDWIGIRYENAFSNPMRLGATLRVAGEEIANLIIPEGATEISNYAFLNGQFVSVSIPTSVTSVSSTAFSGCTTIGKVSLCGTLPPATPTVEEVQGWQMIDGGIFQISQTNEYLKTSILRIAVDGPRKFSFRWSYNLNDRFFSIDGQGSYYSYQGFPSSASWHDVSISIPEGSHELKWTFSTDDMYSGYYGNIDLTEWWRSNPSVIKSIFPDSFINIASVTIIDGSEKVDPHFCEGCSSLTEISIPASITSIGECAFSGCSGLQSVQIPSSVTNIDAMAFSDCDRLTSMTIPNEVISIGDCAFENCTHLKVLSISDGVAQIGSNAFRGCSGLESVTIPSSVTSIGNDVFSGCNSIANATVPGRKCGIDFSAVTNLIVAEGTSSIDANALRVATCCVPSNCL